MIAANGRPGQVVDLGDWPGPGGRKVSMAIRVPNDNVVNLTHVIGNFALSASSRSAYEHLIEPALEPRSCDRESDTRSGRVQFCLRGSSAGFT